MPAEPTSHTPTGPDVVARGLDDEADERPATAADDRLDHSPAPRRHRWHTPLALFWASHPRQAAVMAAGLAVAALLAGRGLREIGVVAATALVGQVLLGWHNDVVDRERDRRHGVPRKPAAAGDVDAETLWFAIILGAFLLVPLAFTTGFEAGAYYLGYVLLGGLSNLALREGRFSWLLWGASFALLPSYLTWGGWGGNAVGDAPHIAITVLAGLLGVGVHVGRSVWGLAEDDEEDWSTYPLRIGRRHGANRVLGLAAAWIGLSTTAIAVVAGTVGLRAG